MSCTPEGNAVGLCVAAGKSIAWRRIALMTVAECCIRQRRRDEEAVVAAGSSCCHVESSLPSAKKKLSLLRSRMQHY